MAAAGISALSRPAPMKVQVISRSKQDYIRSSDKDMHKVHRNADPKLHPFEKAREFTRALNAVKLDKMFAKPFVYALSDHHDSIYCLNTLPNSLVHLLSGACDGGTREESEKDAVASDILSFECFEGCGD